MRKKRTILLKMVLKLLTALTGLAVVFLCGMATGVMTSTGRMAELGTEKTLNDVNTLLKSQYYLIRFRQTPQGISMTFPANVRLIAADRDHDVESAVIFR